MRAVDVEALIDRTAAAVAPGYRSLDLSGAAGLLLATYYDGDASQLAPLALELTEVNEHVDRDGYQEELGMPEVEDDPDVFELCEALNERIESDDDGYVLIEAYWLALAGHLHRLLGIPVLAHDVEMPIGEQLRRQRAAKPAGDPLAGLDVALSLRVDEHRVAAIFVREEDLWGAGRVPDPDGGWPLDRVTELGTDPQVLGGRLPRGAAAAEVQDRSGRWHEATVGPGVWLCVLPQRSGQVEPAVRYRDAAGHPVDFQEEDDDFSAGVPDEEAAIDAAASDAEQVLRGARLPALWPRQAGGRAELFGWEGGRDAATALGLAGGGCRVWIAPSAADPRQAYARHLVDDWGYRPETAALRAREIPVTELPGSIDGQATTLALAAPAEQWMEDEGWVATAAGDGFAVLVTGFDAPPDRLDLVPL